MVNILLISVYDKRWALANPSEASLSAEGTKMCHITQTLNLPCSKMSGPSLIIHSLKNCVSPNSTILTAKEDHPYLYKIDEFTPFTFAAFTYNLSKSILIEMSYLELNWQFSTFMYYWSKWLFMYFWWIRSNWICVKDRENTNNLDLCWCNMTSQ